MYINNLMNKFGYSEMYEWSELFKYDIVPFGRFVSLSHNDPGKIKLYKNDNDLIIGVTTVNAVCTSDDPDEWQGKYLCNEFGDYLLQEKPKVIAYNGYDDVEEIPYIGTIRETEVVPVINEQYESELTYKKRSERNEWVRVNLLGKCIVVDNGQCMPGHYCMPYEGGIAVPYNNVSLHKYYVIDRLTEDTIMIFFK